MNGYKDWNENPVTNDSYEMVHVCKKDCPNKYYYFLDYLLLIEVIALKEGN